MYKKIFKILFTKHKIYSIIVSRCTTPQNKRRRKKKAGDDVQIEKLEDNKVQVILTTADLTSMNIDINSLSGESVELNAFLFNIMERIKEETGFNPYGGQVLMEAMPIGDDGISIMVSKVHSKSGRITRTQFKRLRAVRAKTDEESDIDPTARPEVFYIETFDDVCAALSEMSAKTLMVSSLYKMDSMYGFLAVKNAKTARDIEMLSEFSYRQSYYPLQEVYIREHGELIAAGRRLVSMAKGIKELNGE